MENMNSFDGNSEGSDSQEMNGNGHNGLAYEEMVEWIKRRIKLPKFDSLNWQEEHDDAAIEFISNPECRSLFAAMSTQGQLKLTPHDPRLLPMHHDPTAPQELVYFIRPEGLALSQSNLHKLQYGFIEGAAVHSLLRVMNGVYGPALLHRPSWPEAFRKDFTGHFHKFMASLTETSFQVLGKTVLYLPADLLASIVSPSEAARDKDLVQQLESIVIHWTRQIKEVVNNHDNALNTEISGPLGEIKFWQSRTVDLSGISEQLHRDDVRRVVLVLEHAKSSYLGPFETLSQRIDEGSVEANNNLKFLQLITEPCQALSVAEPRDIPGILPHLLNCIRMIWTLSRFYNTEERLTGLLRKISNEIINRCCAKISLSDIFDGMVESSMQSLEESIACGEEWKEAYKKTEKIIRHTAKSRDRYWDFNQASIFAQIDAFVQRCRDLLEVCEGQIQFCRRSESTGGKPGALPEFGGTRGQEIAKALMGVQASFEVQIERLKHLDYNILDVKTSRWHDDYNLFKNVVKDLEVMYTNVINNIAFDNITRVPDCVGLLEMFHTLARRGAVKRCVEKRVVQTLQLFKALVDRTRNEFDNKKNEPPLRPYEPEFAGAAVWAQGLATMVQESWQLLKDTSHFLLLTREGTKLPEAEDAEKYYMKFISAINDFKNGRYEAWKQMLEAMDSSNLASRLENNLMKRSEAARFVEESLQQNVFSKTASGHLVLNFDQDLLALFTEVHYWEKFQGEFTIPYVAHDICNQQEKLRVMREHVMLIVRAYNEILNDLKPDERKLFSDHIRRLDKRINQGINKLTWTSKGIIEYYVKGSCEECFEVHRFVKKFHASREAIAKCCHQIERLMLVRIDKNSTYDDKVFAEKQAEHRSLLKQRLEGLHFTIKQNVKDMYENFKDGSGQVKSEWRAMVAQIDKDIEQALRYCVKKSLQELSKAINGDAKTEPQTLFKINIVLDNSRVDYRPTMINLTHAVNIVAKELISSVMVIPRLKEALAADEAKRQADVEADRSGGASPRALPNSSTTAPPPQPAPSAQPDLIPSFYSIISNDEDTLKVVMHIMNGMSSSATELQKYLSYWDKYKFIWESDKEGYIRRYAKANRTLEQFQADTQKYKEQQADIQGEDISHNINFIKIDCTSLKTDLVNHTLEWQGKLTGLLNRTALAELETLHELFDNVTTRLRQKPLNLDELGASLKLLEEQQKNLPEIAARFEPLEKKYEVLKNFEVAINDTEQKMLESLRGKSEDFKIMLEETNQSLVKSKNEMKRDLEISLENYNQAVISLRQESQDVLPYHEATIKEAFQKIAEFKQKAEEMRQQQSRLQAGLDIFSIPSPEHKELKDVEKEIDLLEKIWTLTKEWNEAWDGWKTGVFRSLNIEDMESAAGTFNKTIGRLGREIKGWKTWQLMKEKVDQFRQTMPLIMDLKNPGMRERHWDALRQEVNKVFDPTSDNFTLNSVFELQLYNHADFIGDLSSNANKELAIETALQNIEGRWRDVKIDIGEYKDIYHKIKSTDDLFQVLEDDSVAISTQKASKFYHSFKVRIDYWEKTLGRISEIVEMLLQVQRKWIYLESIFIGSDDIAKQLPMEAKLFGEVNTVFKKMMRRVHDDPNAVRACSFEGMLGQATEMDDKLDAIQKSLDKYLETKRVIFPRFYFVSDDDLLEILGQSRDPNNVQKHIKKCFEGIKSLNMVPPGTRGNKCWEGSSMIAPDTESADFVNTVICEGAVEMWLLAVEREMRLCLQRLLALSITNYKGKKEKWVKDTLGQLLITTGAIVWTNDCQKALNSIGGGNKTALKHLKKKQVSYLSKLTDMVRSNLTKVERSKLVALITMEIHNRDVMERMVKKGCSAVTDFEWLQQLRFVFAKDEGQFGNCFVEQTNSRLEYSYEYQGNNGRLVVTPLTDRCVLTLTTAMFLNRGGNPLGPAGTGKTETVKDLGKNLAKYVVVINCSDGMDYKSVGRIFSGLVQSGSWGCFDEFNRIKIEVISVVAMQVHSILTAMSQKAESFNFMGSNIKCNLNCGIFITMNPGYAGRTELPDNLKALMRPVAMMVPDLAMIAEVMLASEGFREAKGLAKKTITLYNLMIQQLSKQDHYDYGLRNLKAVLNMAGSLKRADPHMNEEAILMRALRDMNLPKFIKDDEHLFRLLLSDLFPSLELPISEYGQLQVAIERELSKKFLQKHPFLISKIIQLYDSQLTRHCNMMVGSTLSGKSIAWRTLQAAKTALGKEDGIDGFNPVYDFVMNPKSVTLNELYGAYDLQTFEWADGILSTIFKACSENEKPEEKWLVFDGPVDALWIESMNSVMDDNKILTLINGDRIPLNNTMALLFEVEDLAVASPATVSRAGMIYIDGNEMGWRPLVDSWMDKNFNTDKDVREYFNGLFEKYVVPILIFKEANCREPVPIADFNAVESLICLYDAIAKDAGNGLQRREEDPQKFYAVAEKWFVYCTIWSVMAAVDEVGRKMLDAFLRDIEAQFPPSHKVYDYFVDPKKNDWELWESRVPNWRPLRGQDFHSMIVPTVDTVRNAFVLNTVVLHKRHALLTGETGTGKTVLGQSQLMTLPETHSQLVINFSAQTKSIAVQNIIEGAMEKRSKDKWGPTGGKQLVILIDDFNMPQKTSYESPFQPPLELLRLWMDYKGWYDRIKCMWRFILDTQLIAAMAPPSGGRQVISARTQSRFHVVNLTQPSDDQMIRIFESILSPKLAELDNEVKSLGSKVAQATLKVFQLVVEQFLPTPDKFHYLFNIRDVSKVVQGVLQAQKQYVDSKEALLRLWTHECQRVFSDRFLQDAADDGKQFIVILEKTLKEMFDCDWANIMAGTIAPSKGTTFCSFLQEGTELLPYEEVTDFIKLKSKLNEKLEDYNIEPKLVSMDLVLFGDAIGHICRIHRVLLQPRGNLMLVGVGGSGRQSLSRLSSYIADYQLFCIEITKNYRQIEFREDLKSLYEKAGIEDKRTTFLFNDTQIKEESFLEDLNNILSSGEVPNLFGKEDMGAIYDGVRAQAKAQGVDETPENMWRLFVNRVRTNLHLVLCMSPVGDGLRSRCRMFPGLVSCTTIDWFHTWPADALQEVGMKFLSEVKLDTEAMRVGIAKVFATMQLSVIVQSSKMLKELKRHNYVTPTNYLELVKGYRGLLNEKRTELGESCNKLANGLAKLEESRVQVEDMSVQLAKKQVVVDQSQKACEELLVEIVSERRVADEQKKQVEADSERIGKEAIECNAIAADAEADLAVAMPALEKAMAEVDKLEKSSITEVKSFTTPPPAVVTVLSAVCILFNKQQDWNSAKKLMSEPNFLQQIKYYDKDHVSSAVMNKIKKFVSMPDFNPDEVRTKSSAAAALCTWVHAIYVYGNVAKEVAPKRARLKEAQDGLQIKQEALAEAQKALAEVTEKVQALKNSYDKSVNEKNALKQEAEGLENKLARADKLVTGLAGEYTRWQASIEVYKALIRNLVGDALVAAAFLSYAGPFDSKYRTHLVGSWLHEVNALALPFSDGFDFANFLANPTDVRDWNIKGLPKDDFSTENGVIVTRGNRWPLMIDPQAQANKWVKKLEGSKLRVIDLNMKDFLREIENAIVYGMPVLLEDVLEELDPSLESVLSKAVLKIGNREVIKVGDKELDYNHDFRLYITTKLGNPHYTPEVSTKTTVVNFVLSPSGLDAQLLGIVVQKEQPSLEEQKSELTLNVAAGKKKLVELENTILRLLSETKGSLLDDENLVNTLQISKVTSEEVTQKLAVAEETEIKIDAAREGYRSAALRSSIAYFVLADMAKIDPMYQFSLEAYVQLFEGSIEQSKAVRQAENVSERCQNINAYHTERVYINTCRALFESHKLLFSMQLCFRILMQDGKIPMEEFNFLLYGGGLSDRATQRINPAKDWIDETMWDNISELDKLPSFMGIAGAFEQTPREWHKWYLSPCPDEEPLPSDWDAKCSDLQALCLLRALRLDRVLFGAARYVSANLGPAFVDPPAFDLKGVLKDSNCKTPLIFVLSPGVDPTAQVAALAETSGQRLENCALGQGQAPVAISLINRGLAEGIWIFLANCHLMLSWMPELEKIIANYRAEDPHPDFRLWLSCSPAPNFPIAILQQGLKMTTEPPKGLRANQLKLYNLISEDQFSKCGQQHKYKKLLFSLTWFHAILLERRKFKALGFNIPYDFNESDFSICHDLVVVFLDVYADKTPFEAMRYLIADANYGGRVTDDWDRRLVKVYINQFVCEDAIEVPNYPLSELRDYFIPQDGDLNSYKDFVKSLPQSEHPLAFGQHPNADISSQIEDAVDLLTTTSGLQPKVAAEGEQKKEDKILRQAEGLQELVPQLFNLRTIKTDFSSRSDPEPMKTVLYQEVERYNKLLKVLHSMLEDLKLAVQGLIIVTPDLEEVMESMLEFKVPRQWSFCYPSIKPLGSWMRDLSVRCQQFNDWVEYEMPKVFWLPGFTYPTGFNTALMQTSARQNGIAIDTLSWEFQVITQEPSTITQHAKEGAYVHGLYLEGARWDPENGYLTEPQPMELYSEMPVIHFKPVENKKKASKGTYICPMYMYPVRTGTRERPSFVIEVELRSGKHNSDFWVKRGTALLLSIAQ